MAEQHIGRRGCRTLAHLGCAVLVILGQARAHEQPLLAPLTTTITATEPFAPEAAEILARLTLDDAPDDCRVGAWFGDDQGTWFQRLHPQPLGDGEHEIRFALAQRWQREPDGGPVTLLDRAAASRFGLLVTSAGRGGVLRLDSLHLAGQRTVPLQPEAPLVIARQLPRTGRCGERWEARFHIDPAPSDPYDPAIFAAWLIIEEPDGQQQRIPGFHLAPRQLLDRGDREISRRSGPDQLCLRFRPRCPGVHRLRLETQWAGGKLRTLSLPTVTINGPASDEQIRIDAADPRFLARGEAFFWPIGINLASPHDQRGHELWGTRCTPDRGSHSYAASLARLGRAGGTCSEIWLSAWNLALEWDSRWPGFHGAGQYHQGNAARLDRILDDAQAAGVALLINIRNHGQGKNFIASRANDEGEWPFHPYRAANGGSLQQPEELFTHPDALAWQDRLRRYLVARYADHPAVAGWKLWSEVDLTSLGLASIRRRQRSVAPMVAWHEQAAARLATLDTYDHPIATHFATTYRWADPQLCAIPGIDLIGIDTYHSPLQQNLPPSLAELIHQSLADRHRGLGRFGKAVLSTEYGGSHNVNSEERLLVEWRTAAFAALVSGHAGAPLLWWHQWVDQADRWQPLQAIAAFTAGEDLRGASRSVRLHVRGTQQRRCWARAWARNGRLLCYLLDHDWASTCQPSQALSDLRLRIGSDIKAGPMRLEWWHPDRGVCVDQQDFQHPGDALDIPVPTFRHHLAGKLIRLPAAPELPKQALPLEPIAEPGSR